MLGFKWKNFTNMYQTIRWNSWNSIKVRTFTVKENLQNQGAASESLKCTVQAVYKIINIDFKLEKRPKDIMFIMFLH